MKNFNFKKTIIALLLGIVFALCAVPTNLGNLFAHAEKDAYKKPSTVDIKGSFDNNTSSKPEKWTESSQYNNDDDIDSTSFNGVISTELTGWNKQVEEWINSWLTNWDTNHKYTFGDANRATIKEELKNRIVKQVSPLTPKFNEETTTDHKVLALMSGSTFTKYLNDEETALAIETADRTGYVKYTSNEFTLDQYSFYKISIFVKTTDGAQASISLSGDIDKTAFESITTSETKADKTYYIYTFSDGANTKKIVTTTPNETPELTYAGHKYIFSTDKYVPDTTHSEYSAEIKDYSLTYTGESTTTNDSDWTEYTIYISTTTETKLSLSLALGNNEAEKSTGNVFFDNVTVEKIQLLDFYNDAIDTSTTKVYDNREIKDPNNTDSRNYTVIQDFENNHNWTLSNAPLDGTDLVLVEETNVTGYQETFPQNNPAVTNKVLKVNNHDTAEIKLKSGTITLDKNRYYRISIWALSLQSSSTMTTELIATKASGENGTSKDTTKPYVSDRNNTDASSVTNFWVNYIFYVKAPAEKNSEAYLTITLPAGAIVYFDNFVVETVSKAEFTDTKNNKLDLSTTITNPIVSNGNFFEYDSVKEHEYSTPLPPSNWTNSIKSDVYEYYDDVTSDKFSDAYLEQDLVFSSDEKTITLNGKEFTKADNANTYNYKDGETIKEKIVLVKDKLFTYNSSKSAYINTTYDLEIETDIVAGIIQGNSTSNILSISTTVPESASYKSGVIDMKATGSLYIISVDVRTDISAIANLKLVDSNDKVYASISNINTYDTSTSSSNWKTYKFYVGTGLETIKLQLVLEFEEHTGTVEFKNVNGLNTTTTSVLSSKLSKSHEELLSAGIAVVDLQKESFIEHSNSINTTTHLYDATLYKAVEISGKTSGIYGILDTTNAHTNFSSITAKDAEVSPYVLVIQNDAGESTQLEASKKFTLSTKKYMKITVIARAEGLSEGKSANITFTSLNKSFDITDSEFKEYVLYVDNSKSENSATIDYVISLLDSAGTVVIDSISIESPENLDNAKSEYPDGDTDTVKFTVANVSEETEKEDEKDKENDLELEEENKTLEIFMAVLSSLLLVAAIVFAIVYTRIKAIKRPRKHHEKNKVKETDDGQKGFV